MTGDLVTVLHVVRSQEIAPELVGSPRRIAYRQHVVPAVLSGPRGACTKSGG